MKFIRAKSISYGNERIFENDVEPSTAMHDHQMDCALINRDEEIDCEEEAQG